MPLPLPSSFKTAAPSALDYFASLVAEDASLPLTEASAAIALDEHPAPDVQAVLAVLDDWAARLKRRLPPDAAPLQRLRALGRYFFNELGFAGNLNDYYARGNSYLHEVLRTRRGIPISLAVVYLELAGQIGLSARGIAFPGHFLIKVKMPRGEVVLDPMSGQSLSRDELDERLLPYKRRQGLQGDFDMPLGLFLQAAPSRDILARMLRNLKEIHRSAEDWPRLVGVQQRLALLLPGDAEERRDLGLARAELGLCDEAAQDLEAYVKLNPQAADRRAMLERAGELRQVGRPRLH
jgi:regulator of sirC expression with transglutaminase-like and TPR domain